MLLNSCLTGVDSVVGCRCHYLLLNTQKIIEKDGIVVCQLERQFVRETLIAETFKKYHPSFKFSKGFLETITLEHFPILKPKAWHLPLVPNLALAMLPMVICKRYFQNSLTLKVFNKFLMRFLTVQLNEWIVLNSSLYKNLEFSRPYSKQSSTEAWLCRFDANWLALYTPSSGCFGYNGDICEIQQSFGTVSWYPEKSIGILSRRAWHFSSRRGIISDVHYIWVHE